MLLKNHHENIGILKELNQQDGHYELTFLTEKTIELPEEAFDKKILEILVGRTLGIANIDGVYKIRIIEEVK